jgi:hypothetical protein
VNGEQNQEQPAKTAENRATPLLALTVGFLPSGFILLFLAIGRVWDFSAYLKIVLFSMAALSLLCCAISSTMLFHRRTAASICGGLLLLIFNTMIALFLGCTASVSDMFQ